MYKLILSVVVPFAVVSIAAGEDLPNIIFVMADDIGWGDVRYNNGKAGTPNLNEMAHSPNTVLLQRHYSGGPVCSPTRGTVLTGRNHNRYCVWTANAAGRKPSDFLKPAKTPLPLSEITVAEVMKEAGYSTAMFGKWHLGDFKKLAGGNKMWPTSHPGQHGFDKWWATERSAPTFNPNSGCFLHSKDVLGNYSIDNIPTDYSKHPSCINYHTIKSGNIKSWKYPITGDDSHFIWYLAKRYITNQVKSKQPFFLYLPFHTVHIPYIATNQQREKYSTKNYTEDQSNYYGAITALDKVIGKLRNFLKQLGIRNNTLLWFTSDNGPARNTPGETNGLRGHKQKLYEGGIRVPGMIEWPDVISSNKVSWFPVISSDLLPTVHDILGVKPSDDRPMDGISILPFLQGKTEHRNQPMYWGFNIKGNFSNEYMMSTSGDQYKLIVTYKNGKAVHYELYDLLNDLGETTDLKDKLPTVSNKLLNQIEEWRKSVMKSVDKVGCL